MEERGGGLVRRDLRLPSSGPGEEESMSIVKANVFAGLVLIAVGLLFGSFMAAARDIAAIREWLRWPPIRSNQIMYAHAHLGVLGLTNVALGLVLPLAALSSKLRGIASWAAVAAGALVPLGMVMVLLPEPWDRWVYLQTAGFAALLFSVGAGGVGILRGSRA